MKLCIHTYMNTYACSLVCIVSGYNYTYVQPLSCMHLIHTYAHTFMFGTYSLLCTFECIIFMYVYYMYIMAYIHVLHGTNHIKLNVLRAYPFCENAHETDTATDVPVFLFTLYLNGHSMIP